MNELFTHTIATDDTEPTTVSRRLFAGGMLAGLVAAGLAVPAAAQGLKEVDDDRNDDDNEGEIPEEWEEVGITGEYSYESPQFGYGIEWEDPWMIDESDPAMTDVPMAMDELTLLWGPKDDLSVGLAVLGIPAEPGGIVGMGEFLMGPQGQKVWFGDRYDTEQYIDNMDDTSFEFLLALSDPEDGSFSSWVFLVGTEVTPDVWTLSTLVTTDELLEDIFNGFSEKVFVNGDVLVRLTTWNDIERAIR